MSKEAKIQELLASAWHERSKGNYASAKAMVEEARELTQDDNYLALGRIYHIYMQFESDHDNYQEALQYCQQSVDYYKKSENSDKIAHSTRHLADLNRHLKQQDAAGQNYRSAIEIYRANDDTRQGDLANALRGYAILLETQTKTADAIEVWKEVKDLYGSCGIPEGVDEATDRLASLQA